MDYNPTSINIMLLEDDSKFSDLCIFLLQNIGYKHINLARTYEEAWEVFNTQDVDIMLLDIELEGKRSGIDFALSLRKKAIQTPIVFLTNFYTEQSYKEVKLVSPHSFISKDISELRLRQALELPLLERNLESSEIRITQEPSQKDLHSEFYTRIGNEYRKFKFDHIDYIYSHTNGSSFFYSGRQYPTNRTLKEWNSKILPSNFLRIHQTYIINTNKIENINMTDGYIGILGEKLPIGVTYRNKIKEQLLLIS